MLSRGHRYVIALGSNIGDRVQTLAAAVTLIAANVGTIEELSPNYETAPIGAADQLFLNAALRLWSDSEPEALLANLLQVEQRLGRERKLHWGNRTLDLDVLLWQPDDAGDPAHTSIFTSQTLTVPHPEFLKRDFALVPAADVAPDWLHPETGKTLTQERDARGYHLAHFAAPKAKG